VLGWVIPGRFSVMPVGKREERRARGRLADRRLKEMRLGREERSEVQGTSDVGILGSEQEDTRHRTRGGEGKGSEGSEGGEGCQRADRESKGAGTEAWPAASVQPPNPKRPSLREERQGHTSPELCSYVQVRVASY
jgi:hypothetical protein